MILQVTMRCNFDCSFCSETLQLPDPTMEELDRTRANLSGVQRVFLSGGEPLLRRDFGAGEPARTNPFIEEIVVHGKGGFDLVTEVDLFAAQLTALLRTARHHNLLIADKTIANVVAYARVVLNTQPGSRDAAALDAMAVFCRAWAHVYDAVFFCADYYGQQQPGDVFRTRVLDLQGDVAQAVRSTCADIGLSLIDIPVGLTLDERVHWITGRVVDLGLAPVPVA